MKTMIKTFLFLFMTAVIFTSCSSDDSNPPTAKFTVSDDNPTKWDKVVIISQAIEAGEVTYSVSGGTYDMANDYSSIVFFEDKTYTITQTAKNDDGTDTASISVVVTSPENEYLLDGTALPVTDNAFFWDATAMGGTVYIRMLGEVSGQDNPNLIKLFPVPGTNPWQGNYTWGSDGDIGTYDAAMTANYAGMSWDWTTKGDSGNDLKIELIYEDSNDSKDNIYDITLLSYTLNYGNYTADWTAFISEGTKPLSLYYRGKIDPVE